MTTALTYRSTRGQAPALGFDDVLLTGLAPDGGLYLPDAFPRFDEATLTRLAGAPYTDVAAEVFALFTGEAANPGTPLRRMIDTAYARFAHPAVAPLVQMGADHFLLELFHGPTLAFKDVAMQILGPLFADRLGARGEAMTIVAATSGDTGGAAIEAMANRPGIGICVLHPRGRISEVQRRLMTTVSANNVLNIAVDGTFDDCQALVKAMFADERFRNVVRLGAVNSINWARIVAQIVYYVTASLSLARLGQPVSFSVPTGNFGDIFAGYVAKQMGAPVGQLIVATNENDILDRALRTNAYTPTGVVPTQSPSMDIQVSSNFERLLFLAAGRDAERTRMMMAALKGGQGFELDADIAGKIAEDFASYRADEAQTSEMMALVQAQSGMLVDPHTAVGLVASTRAREEGLRGPIVTLATAHPAKFPDAVAAATGQTPPLGAQHADLFDREERLAQAPNDLGQIMSMVEQQFGSAA